MGVDQAQQLIADKLGEELAESVLAQENEAVVRSEEIVELAKNWPTFRGKNIGSEEIRAWLQQVDNPQDQRILFTILKRTRVFSEALVRERLKAAFGILRPSLPTAVFKRKNERRRDILITYIDGEGKSGSHHASMYAEENKIGADLVVAPSLVLETLKEIRAREDTVSAIVVIDDIAATGNSLSDNIVEFIERHRDFLDSTLLQITTVVATERGQSNILRTAAKFPDLDIDFRTCEILPSENYALPADKSGFQSEEDWERAKSLIENLGAKIDKRRPLGFGQMGILVVFPTNVPNNTLPIIRSYSRSSSGSGWRPLFERISH